MNTRNVTNTAFVSYPATGMQLPNGRQLANSYDALYRRTLVQDVTNSVNVAAWQFFGPSRVAEVVLGNGLICTWMNNARTNSAVQPSVTNPSWGNQFSDRLGYDGAGRPITKRYLAGGIDGATGAYNDSSSVVGFTTEYDLASNKFYERHLHCEERSHLYEPFQYGAPTGGYDSLSRLRQYQRGTLTPTTASKAAVVVRSRRRSRCRVPIPDGPTTSTAWETGAAPYSPPKAVRKRPKSASTMA